MFGLRACMTIRIALENYLFAREENFGVLNPKSLPIRKMYRPGLRRDGDLG
jgi:hypothetical protein